MALSEKGRPPGRRTADLRVLAKLPVRSYQGARHYYFRMVGLQRQEEREELEL